MCFYASQGAATRFGHDVPCCSSSLGSSQKATGTRRTKSKLDEARVEAKVLLAGLRGMPLQLVIELVDVLDGVDGHQ